MRERQVHQQDHPQLKQVTGKVTVKTSNIQEQRQGRHNYKEVSIAKTMMTQLKGVNCPIHPHQGLKTEKVYWMTVKLKQCQKVGRRQRRGAERQLREISAQNQMIKKTRIGHA